ncbi:MAG TPA: M61 family peptidase, partial [Terriglobales bacterium]|nr:M61 family peptidase [Terriglobales bacterium]
MRKPSPLVFSAISLFFFCAVSAAQNAPITLNVDAREAPRRIFHVRLSFPVSAGPLTLYYPKWLPGNHRPTGPIANLVGLHFSASGQVIPWNRDDVDMYAFHVNVPAGASTLEAGFDYVTPSHGPGRFDPVSTDQLMILNWNVVLLYPAGKPARDFTYNATLELPAGWKFGTALPVSSHSSSAVAFAPAPLNTLIDSPVLAGANYRAVPLPAPGSPPQELDIAADSAAVLEIPEESVADYTRLMAEAGALFGAHHYRDYHFLLTLSDVEPPNGLEHHESSDDRAPERTLIDPSLRKLMASLLPHEYAHSWNGKYRRPAGLATPDYQQPMKGELLWVYEGLTTYLGEVLAARSGLYTPAQFREQLALTAAQMDHRAGRLWRPLEDTAVAAQILYEAPREWTSWRRSADFYPESELTWLEADTIIRKQTNGRRSLDDFCRAFEGPPSGPP